MTNTCYERDADNEFYFAVMRTRNNRTAAHFHNCTELIAVEEGAERVAINGTDCVLHAGEFAISNPFDVHYYEYIGSSRVSVVMLSDEFTADFRKYAQGNLPNFMFRTDRSEEVIGLIDKMGSLPPDRLLRAGYANILLGTLSELYPLVTRKKVNTGFADILRYLDARYAEPLTIQSVSAALGYSPTYFSALFNRITGIHFREYLNRLRLRKTDEYMHRHACKVTEAISACGFESANTYYRARKLFSEP